MEHYLSRSLSDSNRDTQVLFCWPELWLHYRWEDQWLDRAFSDLEFNQLEEACAAECADFHFNGWHINWTGWKRLTNSDVLVSQWIAYSTKWDGWHLYSSYPGGCQYFTPGFIFDISIQPGQRVPTTRSSEADLDSMRREGLYTLLKMIATTGEPPYLPPWSRQ